MKKVLQRGFTLIELLVVIAIIGILAAVVLASLNDARSSGSDASAKSSMSSVRTQMELFYTKNNFAYTGGCADASLDALSLAILANSPADTEVLTATLQTGTTYNCHAAAATWVASTPLAGGGYFCVDSTGFAGNRATPLSAAATACPAS